MQKFAARKSGRSGALKMIDIQIGGEPPVSRRKFRTKEESVKGRNERLVFGPSSENLCSGAMFIDTVDERRCQSEHALFLILFLRCIHLGPYRFAAFTGWICLE